MDQSAEHNFLKDIQIVNQTAFAPSSFFYSIFVNCRFMAV